MIRISIALMILASASTAAAAAHEVRASDSVSETVPDPQPLSTAEEPARVFSPSHTARDRADADEVTKKTPESSAIQSAADGGLSAFSVAPGVPRAATGLALAGYDSAANAFRARGMTEGRLLSFLAARIEYDHGPANGPNDRVSLGLRATFLNQAAHGVDFGALLFYQPRDFRDEGEVVAGLLVARHFDRLTLVLNPLLGSDPEGDDQSFELRCAGLYKVGSWLVVGLDSRGRYNLSTDQKRAGHSTIDWEAQAGASAAFGVGPLLVSTLVGPSFLQRTSLGLDANPVARELRPGLMAMAGAGASF